MQPARDTGRTSGTLGLLVQRKFRIPLRALRGADLHAIVDSNPRAVVFVEHLSENVILCRTVRILPCILPNDHRGIIARAMFAALHDDPRIELLLGVIRATGIRTRPGVIPVMIMVSVGADPVRDHDVNGVVDRVAPVPPAFVRKDDPVAVLRIRGVPPVRVPIQLHIAFIVAIAERHTDSARGPYVRPARRVSCGRGIQELQVDVAVQAVRMARMPAPPVLPCDICSIARPDNPRPLGMLCRIADAISVDKPVRHDGSVADVQALGVDRRFVGVATLVLPDDHHMSESIVRRARIVLIERRPADRDAIDRQPHRQAVDVVDLLGVDVRFQSP